MDIGTTIRAALFVPAALTLLALQGCEGEKDPLADREEETTLGGAGGDELEVVREAPREMRLGEEFSYRIRIRNEADQTLQGIVLQEQPPQGFELIDARVMVGEEQLPAAAGESARPGEARTAAAAARREQPMDASDMRFDIGALAPDQEAIVEITGVAHEEGEVEGCMLVRYDAPICSTWRVVDPKLRAEVAVENDTYWICEEIEVAIRVANRGTGTVEAGRVRFELPEGLQSEDGEGALELEFDSIDADDSFEKKAKLRATRGGRYEIRASAETATLSVRSRSEPFRVLDPRVELSIGEFGQIPLGSAERVAVRIMNTGETAVEDLSIQVDKTENVDAAAFFRHDEDEEPHEKVEFDELAPGETRTLMLAVRPDEVGDVNLRIVLEGRCLDGANDRIEQVVRATAVGIPAARLEVTDLEDPVSVGNLATYRILVKNQGTGDDLGATVRLELPEQLEFVDGEGAAAVVKQQDGTVLLGPIERIGPGESVEWEIRARAVAPGQTHVRVSLASDATRSPVHEEEPTTLVD